MSQTPTSSRLLGAAISRHATREELIWECIPTLSSWSALGLAIGNRCGRSSSGTSEPRVAAALAELGNLHAAEDATQAAWLLAFRRLDTLRDGSRFAPWLLQIVRRQAIEVHRKRQVTVPMAAEVAESHSPSESPPGDYQDLLRLVDRLPDHERLLVGMRHFDGHSVAEIAALTGRPVGTVTKQLSRAHARLRGWLEEDER